jgi:hypothetical protein
MTSKLHDFFLKTSLPLGVNHYIGFGMGYKNQAKIKFLFFEKPQLESSYCLLKY